MWKHNTQKTMAHSTLQRIGYLPIGYLPWWPCGWLGAAATAAAQEEKRVSPNTSLAQEKIKIHSRDFAECILLLYHHKIQKMVSQTIVSHGISTLQVLEQPLRILLKEIYLTKHATHVCNLSSSAGRNQKDDG
jgi:hypothetical protein